MNDRHHCPSKSDRNPAFLHAGTDTSIAYANRARPRTRAQTSAFASGCGNWTSYGFHPGDVSSSGVGRIWISGQANIISQWHPAFHSPYSGMNSLSPQAQDASSRVLTLYTGLRLTRNEELLCDIQETGGHGLGEAFGLAGFTNLDVVRNPSLGKGPYVARLMWHQVISLSHNVSDSVRTPFSLFGKLPERRLELRFGKFGIADFFDLNTYGSDSSFQFLNSTVDNNGAYDYAADTRGYTFGAVLEYHDRHGAVRFAEALMPKVANVIHLDPDLSRQRS